MDWHVTLVDGSVEVIPADARDEDADGQVRFVDGPVDARQLVAAFPDVQVVGVYGGNPGELHDVLVIDPDSPWVNQRGVVQRIDNGALWVLIDREERAFLPRQLGVLSDRK